jgi:peptide deformylase
MALLEIKKYPEKILREKTTPVNGIDGQIQRLIDDMIETMYAAGGIGLAANQVGIPKRLCIIDVSRISILRDVSIKEEQRPLIVLINPLIVAKEENEEAEEGCLSIPGYRTNIKRAGKIHVKGFNREGKPIEIEATGLLSRALQHEIDHLDGLLIIDRISPIKREFFKRRYKKFIKTAPSNK